VLIFILMLKLKVKVIPQQVEVGQGVLGSLRPRIFLTFGTTRMVGSSAINTGRLYPKRNPWYSFSEAESTPWHMVSSGGSHGKKSPVTPPGFFFCKKASLLILYLIQWVRQCTQQRKQVLSTWVYVRCPQVLESEI